MRQGRRIRTTALRAWFRGRRALALALLLVSGCRRSPQVDVARLAEGAASWSAAVQFAAEMERAGRVPGTYLRDTRSTAAERVAALRDEILNTDGMDADTRSRAAALCARLASAVQGGDRMSVAEQAALRDLERALRELAQRARAGAGP
jgi:hypothetical protein